MANSGSQVLNKLINVFRSNATKLSNEVFTENKQDVNYSLNQINDAICFMEYYKKYEKLFKPTHISVSPAATIDASSIYSLFEVLVSLYTNVFVGKNDITIILDDKRMYLKSYFEQLGLNITFLDVPSGQSNGESSHGIQIIFDSADVPTALLELLNAGRDKTSPWRIRSCWVQESLKDSYFNAIASLSDKPENKNSIYALPIVIGESEVSSDLNISVNFFRTAKEVVELIKSTQSSTNLCASIWTENVSLAYEVASNLPMPNIWLNSVGLLDPVVPFTFGKPCSTQMYGSLLALCQFATQLHSLPDANTDPKTVFETFLDDYIEDYTSFHIVDGKGIFFKTTTKPRKPDEMVYIDNTVIVTDKRLRQLVANILYNKQKTIVTPFGTTFAN